MWQHGFDNLVYIDTDSPEDNTGHGAESDLHDHFVSLCVHDLIVMMSVTEGEVLANSFVTAMLLLLLLLMQDDRSMCTST